MVNRIAFLLLLISVGFSAQTGLSDIGRKGLRRQPRERRHAARRAVPAIAPIREGFSAKIGRASWLPGGDLGRARTDGNRSIAGRQSNFSRGASLTSRHKFLRPLA